jgi:hypothetical protein
LIALNPLRDNRDNQPTQKELELSPSNMREQGVAFKDNQVWASSR